VIVMVAVRAFAAVFLLSLQVSAFADSPRKNETPLTDNAGRVRAQLVARNEVVLSSELSAKIDSLPLREGDAFRAGQALVSFDCTLFKAQLNKAQSTLDAARQRWR